MEIVVNASVVSDIASHDAGVSLREIETGEETVVRECLEEVGCVVKIIRKLETVTVKTWESSESRLKVTLCCYECLLVKKIGDHKMDKKIHAVQWVSKSEMQDLDLLPTIEDFLQEAE